MRITVNSDSLSRALKTAGKVVPAKASLPQLECFLLDARGSRLVVLASNMEVSVKIPVPISANEADGVCAVPAKKFSEHVSLLPDGDVTLSTEGFTMTISWAKGSTKMQMMDHKLYPSVSEPSADSKADFPAQDLLAALSATIPACAKDTTRPQLCGVHFDIDDGRTRVVASDTRVLTYDTVRCPAGFSDSFTIPTVAASLIKGAIRKESTIVRMTRDDNNVSFNLGDAIIISRKVSGVYPKYMSIIPERGENTATAVADREGLVGTLRRLAACSSVLRMRLTPLSILFSASNKDTGSSASEDCDCSYNGEEMTVGINPVRLLDILENITSAEVVLELTSPRKPIIATAVSDGDNDSLSLLMPLAIS